MIEQRTFLSHLECRYLLHTHAEIGDETLLALTLHGYGSNPEVMLRLTRAMLGDELVIASIQAPSQFYLKQTPDSPVGYCWATHSHSEESVRMHHEMLLYVIEELEKRFQIPSSRRILVGFSQPVGLNYRFAATHPSQIGGVIGICGGVPKDWEEGSYQKVSAALLHIARREDEIYPPSVTEKYADRLRLRADDVEFHLLDGGHRFPSKGGVIAEAWLQRLARIPNE